MDILGKLFGGGDKVKVMRLFMTNPDLIFEIKEVARRSKIKLPTARREVALLRQLDFIKPKRGDKTSAGKKINGWQLNPFFPFLSHLRTLLRADILNRQREITDRFSRCGKIKLLVVAGLFIQANESRTDLLLVGDKLKRTAIDRVVKTMEAEVGRELVYAVFDTADFIYRLNAYDKFIRDVLDYPHEKIIDRLNFDGGYPQRREDGSAV
ncbi:MAG: hypothetical protein AAB677_00565 [Patescibacteria group bacterium]